MPLLQRCCIPYARIAGNTLLLWTAHRRPRLERFVPSVRPVLAAILRVMGRQPPTPDRSFGLRCQLTAWRETISRQTGHSLAIPFGQEVVPKTVKRRPWPWTFSVLPFSIGLACQSLGPLIDRAGQLKTLSMARRCSEAKPSLAGSLQLNPEFGWHSCCGLRV